MRRTGQDLGGDPETEQWSGIGWQDLAPVLTAGAGEADILAQKMQIGTGAAWTDGHGAAATAGKKGGHIDPRQAPGQGQTAETAQAMCGSVQAADTQARDTSPALSGGQVGRCTAPRVQSTHEGADAIVRAPAAPAAAPACLSSAGNGAGAVPAQE